MTHPKFGRGPSRPLDYSAPSGITVVPTWTRLLARRNELAVYRTIVRVGGGVQRGKHQLTGFKLLEPGAPLERLTGLLANIHDPDYVTRHIDFTNWFEWTQDLPGAFYLWIIEHLFVHNELARGVLVVDGRQVNLSAVDCAIFLLAGIKDHITPPEQVWALADLVSTPAEHISRELVDAGTSACSWAAPHSPSTGRRLPNACGRTLSVAPDRPGPPANDIP